MEERGNKKIALNTFIIYIRLFITTIVSLLTTRIVLQILGVSDLGLYNVVGSLITMMNVVSIAMHTTTRRYINIEMGRKNGEPNKVFNVCLVLHIGFALLFFIIAETAGIWYIKNYLNVQVDKVNDAFFVFHISTLVACIGLINVPYQALLEAFEKFVQVAMVDIFNVCIKLVAVIILMYYDGNTLRFYALSMCLITFSSFILYHILCYKQYPWIVGLKWYWDKKLYREILEFNNYTALGATAWLGRTQGASILINYFFGTVVNGAFAIAYQIQNFVQMFIGNLGVASAPQITKSFGRGDKEHAIKLCSQINRYTILIMITIFFPLYIELDNILELWLGEIPKGSLVLCQWILIFALLNSFSASIPTLIHATGKIKWFQLIGSFFELVMLPISFILFKIGFPPVSLIIVLCVCSFSYRFLSLWMMKLLIDFNTKKFIFESYLPPIRVIALMVGWTLIYKSFYLNNDIIFYAGILFTGILSLVLVYFFGITFKERLRLLFVCRAIYNKFKKS